jgi:hypothetical protein
MSVFGERRRVGEETRGGKLRKEERARRVVCLCSTWAGAGFCWKRWRALSSGRDKGLMRLFAFVGRKFERKFEQVGRRRLTFVRMKVLVVGAGASGSSACG